MKLETENLRNLLIKGINNNVICFDKIAQAGQLSKSLLFIMIMHGRRYCYNRAKLKKIYINSDDFGQEILADLMLKFGCSIDITQTESLFFNNTELILSDYLSKDWKKDFEIEKASYAPNKENLLIGVGEYKIGDSIITDEYVLLGMY